MKQLSTFSASAYDIRHLQLFNGINNPDITALLADCPVVSIAAGQAVLEANQKGARLLILLRGTLSVATDTQADMTDGGTITIFPGECVGELSVLDEESNPASIIALEECDLLVIGADLLWRLIDESGELARNLLRLLSFRIRAANAQLRRRRKVGEFYRALSMVDGLTCLQNRVWLNDNLPRLIENAHAAENPLAIIMIDLDHFKRFNDNHGHQAGDDALRVASMVLSDALRPRDFAARYGGEELMVILPNTNLKAGTIVAQRLCERMQQAIVFSDMRLPLPHITASFGLACLDRGQSAHGLIEMADAALYRAKEAGRNCVAV